MSQTKSIRTSTWGLSIKAVLAGLVFLPISALTFVEWFVDPFPNSLWILRILNTKYLVHVRADLTVDGEPLVMERTIRCFNPVDFKLWASSHEQQPGLRSTGQAGDTLAVTTSNGRLFLMNAPDACAVLGSRLRPAGQGYIRTDPEGHDVSPLRLSRGEIETPVMKEIFGGRRPTRIDAYIARNLLRAGYHGIQLNEVLVEKVSGLILKDWDGYEWHTSLSNQWVRSGMGDRFNRYISRYAFVIPEMRWTEIAREILLFNPKDGRPDMLDGYRNMIADAPIASNNPFEQYLTIGHYFNNGYTRSELKLPRLDMQNNRQRYQWFLESIIPCLPVDEEQRSFTCDQSHYGVISSFRHVLNSDKPWIEYVAIGDVRFEALRASGYYLTVSPRQVYGYSQ